MFHLELDLGICFYLPSFKGAFFNLWLWWFNQESFLMIQPVRELLLWATQNYQWFKKMMGLWLLEPLGASHLAQQLKSRDQIKHIWVRAGLWFRAPCSLYYLQIKHTADDFICGRLYWLPHDNAAGYLFLKKWLTVPWQWFSRLRCDRTGEHLDEAHLNYFFFGNRSVKKSPSVWIWHL